MKLPAQDAAARGGTPEARFRVILPRHTAAPLRQVARRIVVALLVMAATVLIVYADRGGYHDNADGRVDIAERAGSQV